jgi:membrane protein
MLLWLYASGLAILIGAEMNAEIEHASPYGKAPGEKVPGQKKKIGPAAARAYEEEQKHPSPHPTLPRRHGPPPPEPTPANVAAGGLIAALFRLIRGRGVRE